MRDKVTLGFVINSDSVVLSFQPFTRKSDGLPLPISLVSPPMPWRKGIVLNMACMVLQLGLGWRGFQRIGHTMAKFGEKEQEIHAKMEGIPFDAL